jgi:tetratricopeptide (TPR) repeat protein
MAERRFAAALDTVHGYAAATAGEADVRALRGDTDSAIEAYEGLVLRRPAVEYVAALIDLYEVTGQNGLANQQRDVVLGIDELYRNAGINTDLAMARFHVQHGDAGRDLELALASYAATPTWEAADILGAAYLRNGDAAMAVAYGQEATQLNPRSAIAHFCPTSSVAPASSRMP